MKKWFLLVLLFSLVMLPLTALGMEIQEAIITTGISEREPIDQVTTQPTSVGKLYCFTRIVGADDETRVTHVWYRGDQEMARVQLPVRSSNWRTWSSKSILPDWAGAWRVEVLDATGNPLTTVAFTLE